MTQQPPLQPPRSWATTAPWPWGDSVAGSSHVLPTGGTTRWASGLSAGQVKTLRQRQAELDEISGLSEIKKLVRELVAVTKDEAERRRLGQNIEPRSYRMPMNAKQTAMFPGRQQFATLRSRPAGFS